ncbi:MAG TPA: hypothetical protein VM077_05005 [Candidatus Limnocylindrales bacterium]|nr:hypothetical protein [Candidatus Limnocylindrales bacterium]
MNSYIFLPIAFLKFWFFEAPREIYGFFSSVNQAFFQLFALPMFLKTFFKPLKNEYRPGLVGFSRAMGMVIKSVIIIADLFILIPLVVFELIVFVSFVSLPLMTILILFL